jgi:hypothetical protein
MKKIAEGVALGRQYSLYEVTGTVQGETTRAETSVSGSVGGGGGVTIQGTGFSRPVSGQISSTTTRYQTIYLKDDDDEREIAINLVDLAVPCREGHRLTARSIDKAVWFDVDNNTTGEGYENMRKLRHHVAAKGLLKYGPLAFAGLVVLVLKAISPPGKMDIPSDLFFGILGYLGGLAVFAVPAIIVTTMRASKITAALARAVSK